MAYNDRTEGPPNRELNLTLIVLGASELSCLLIVIMRLGGSAERNGRVALDTQPLPILTAAASRLGEVEACHKVGNTREGKQKRIRKRIEEYRPLHKI